MVLEAGEKMKLRHFLVYAFLAFAPASVADTLPTPCIVPPDQEPIILSSGFNWPHTGPNNTGIFPTIMREIFCRIGRHVKVVKVPTARSINQANTGYFFGEGPRRWSLAKQYSNLLLLQPPLYDLKFSAFSTKKYPDIGSYSDLAQYRIAAVIGRKSVEDNLTEVMNDFMLASNETLAFRLLKVGRVDFVVIDDFSGTYYGRLAGIKTLHRAELEKHPFHLLVHVKNSYMLPALSNALTDMHQSGEIQSIIKRTLTQRAAIQ
jgi:hypothetical protein